MNKEVNWKIEAVTRNRKFGALEPRDSKEHLGFMVSLID